MKTIETRIEIDATPEQVWAVLTDTARFAEWNPFIRELSGELAIGSRLDVHIQPPGAKGMRFRPTVRAFEPNRELRWLGKVGVRGLFDGEHRFGLESLPGGRTLFTHAETFRGLLVPFTSGMLANTRAGFEAMNRALRDRVAASVTVTG